MAVIGAPEEPRFSEVVAGLKQGLTELGYAPPLLAVQERNIARADEKTAKSVVEGLLRQKAQIFFLIGSRLLKPVREASAVERFELTKMIPPNMLARADGVILRG